MKWFKRISLFALTNIMVMATISIVYNILARVFGISDLENYMPSLILFCLVWGFGGAFISLMISKYMAKRAMGVQIIEANVADAELRNLVQMVHRISKMAGLQKMPEVGIFDSPEINAFATGPSRNNSLVAVSTGLLRAMNTQEVEGVIGHEVAHIANGDMVTMTLIQGIVNAFVLFLARILANLISSQVDDRSRHAVHMGLVMLFDISFAILGSLVVNYYSRQREFRADYGGARFAGKDKMLAGLQRLKSQFQAIEPDNGSMATLKISNRSSGIMALFSTHPSLDDRIARLENAVILR